MDSKKQKYICAAFTAVLFTGIFLFLWLCCPQYLTYQEQYQLFLFGSDYFRDSMAVPGGLADYVSEFIVQFCYIPVYGAAAIALLLAMQQLMFGAALAKGKNSPLPFYCLGALPAVLMLGAFGDENTLLSFAAAVTPVSAAVFLSTLIRRDITAVTVATLCFLPLYWCLGPVTLVYPLCVVVRRRCWLAGLASIAVCVAMVFAVRYLWAVQYPIEELLLGINYYRVSFMHPHIYLVIAAVIILLAALSSFNPPKMSVAVGWSVMAVVAIFSVIYVPSCFDKTKSSIFEYDMLVRQGRWPDIIAKAEKEPPTGNFSLQAVNLALAKMNILGDRMFEFDQKDVTSLIGPARLDNTSTLITAEVLYQLPLTNAALSMTFDLQESIMNNRKSGRFMKRIAECMIINGRYDAARKYVDMLSRSLFYSDWAHEAMKLLGKDKAVEAHPVYGPKRHMAFARNAFYTLPEIEKILTILAVDSKGANTLAWQYANAAHLLKGDLQTVAALTAQYSPAFGAAVTPRHIQEALAMFWTMSHTDFNGVPFEISPEVKSAIASLSATMMRNQNPMAWQPLAKDTYWGYFLRRQQMQQTEDSLPGRNTRNE